MKTVKRLLKSNTGSNGSLDNDRFLRAILQLRNTPDPDCNLSPAQIMFGRPLRDAFSFINRLDKYSNTNIRSTWREAWHDKEIALRQRFHRSSESLTEHSRPLPPLSVGDKCYIQNQTGHHPKRWDRSGTVVEILGNDSYHIKVDGSGRLTRRNRRFLRKFTEPSLNISMPDPTPRIPVQYNSSTTSTPTAPNITTTAPSIASRVQQTDSVVPLATVVPTPCIVQNNVQADRSVHDEEVVDAPEQEKRPRRVRATPKQYEPETGKWIRV